MDQFSHAGDDAVGRRLHAVVDPWQASRNHLAKLFIDYEPGIHWSQIHMQSGITGINSVRAYSILKQSLDHDMNGDFIRTWVMNLPWCPRRTSTNRGPCQRRCKKPVRVSLIGTFVTLRPWSTRRKLATKASKPRTLHAEPTRSKHVRRKFTPCTEAEAGAFNGGVGRCGRQHRQKDVVNPQTTLLDFGN